MKPHWRRREKPAAAGGHEDVLEGVIEHHGRFAFLLSETAGGSDVFLRGRGLDLAMDGDRVRARVRSERGGRRCGEILSVTKRAGRPVVGILRRQQNGWAVFPEKGPCAHVLNFSPHAAACEGSLAALKITNWPTEKSAASGTITETLGKPEDTRAQITALLRSRGFNEIFPKEALAQSEAFQAKPEHLRGREELFRLPIVTIDGADAKDFDDAVSLEDLGGGAVRLGVHIADVSHYVKPGSALDKEAYSRGTSVYLPDRVSPMLPPALSENLCSLRPKETRLTVSVFLDLNPGGEILRRRLAETVIRSCRRLTYEEAQELLDGNEVHAVPKPAAEAVRRMGVLAGVLNARRIKRGALDFNLPEYQVETDANGKPVRVSRRPRLQSHRLIEEFMLLANEAVAAELIAAKLPFLHRRHDAPDPEKMKTLAKTLGDFGLSAGGLTGGNPRKALQEVLNQAQNHPLADIINSLIVRSMRQAVYSPQSSGHFGIAARAYAHFTSPIRRYPDLLVHRAVKTLLGKKENLPPLAGAGEHCSERERAASDVERKAEDMLCAELFKRKIGSTMDGMVTAVTESGAFVSLGETGAEGLLRTSGLKPGQKVSVRVDAVNAAEGKIDLSLCSPPSWRVTRWKK